MIGGPTSVGRCAGIVYLGREEAATSRIIAADRIRAWLTKRGINVRSARTSQLPDSPISKGEIRVGDRALVVSTHGRVALSESLGFERIVFAPAVPDNALESALRNPNVDQAAWRAFIEKMRGALSLALNQMPSGARLHIFTLLPYSAAFALGRLLDESNPLDGRSYRGTPLVIYQQSVSDLGQRWEPFLYPDANATAAKPFFGDLELVGSTEATDGAIVSIEGRHPVNETVLLEEAKRLNARSVYRARCAPDTLLEQGAQASQALSAVRTALEKLRGQKPFPLYILYSGPVSLSVALGIVLRPTVFGKTIVCDYHGPTQSYYPVLDVTQLVPGGG